MQTRYRDLRRAWRRRIRGGLLIGVAAFVGLLAGPVAVLLAVGHRGLAGLVVGIAVGMVWALWSSPPAYIEHWATGAAGEKQTGRQLRGLPAGWAVVHDRRLGRGNLDHLVIGPGGVFALDTKNLSGQVSVDGAGALRVTRREDPDLAYLDGRLIARALSMGQRVSHAVGRPGGRGVWAQPVVVVWGGFAQGHVHVGPPDSGVDVVAGDRLAGWLTGQTARHLNPRQVAAVQAAARDGLPAMTSDPDTEAEPAAG